MEWVPDKTIAGGHFVPVQLDKRPDRIWTLYFEQDASKTPALPITPAHNVNAFMEDYVHDWNFERDGRLRYYTRIMDRSCWILLEFKEP
jgi:hypothetical protein